MLLDKIISDQPTEVLEESSNQMSISSLCKIGINMSDANFWLTRKGSEKVVGKPVKEFNAENIGIKVTATDKIYPDYLFYVFMHLHTTGYWQANSRGTLALKNITVAEVKALSFGLQ